MRLSNRSTWKLFAAGPAVALAGAILMLAAPGGTQAFSGDRTAAVSDARVLKEAEFEAQVASQVRRLSLVKVREIETPKYIVTVYNQGFDRDSAVAVRVDLRNTNQSAFASIRANRKTRIATSTQILATLDREGKAAMARAAEREEERSLEIAEFRAAHFKNGRLQVPSGTRHKGAPAGGDETDTGGCSGSEDLLMAGASGCSGYGIDWHWWGYVIWTYTCDGSEGVLMMTEVNWFMAMAEGIGGVEDLGLGDPSFSGEKTSCACVS